MPPTKRHASYEAMTAIGDRNAALRMRTFYGWAVVTIDRAQEADALFVPSQYSGTVSMPRSISIPHYPMTEEMRKNSMPSR